MAKITINGISFDPIKEPESVPPPPANSRSKYILLQTNPSLTDDSSAELAALGVTILEYLPCYSYLCRYENEDLQPIRALSYISWVADYCASYKLGLAFVGGESPPNYDPDVPDTPVESRAVDIIFHDNVDPKNFQQEVAAAARVDPKALSFGRNKARVNIQTQYLPAVAAIDEVRHIEQLRLPKLLNNIAREILGLVAVNGDAETPFAGEGQIVVVADTGFHNGRKEPDHVHSAFRNGQNESRVLKLYALGRPENPALGLPGNANDPHGHGTHVAGSVLGDGESVGLGKIRGTAPKAQLIVQSLLDQDNKLKLPLDLHDLFSAPYHDDGARIHNDSWGSLIPAGEPDRQALEVDDFVFNGHRDFVICIAAGNEGNDILKKGKVAEKSITSPGTAKNCITVGATESRRPFATTYGDKFSANFPIGSDLRDKKMANEPDSVAALSSRGRTTDERIKPDVVAPGTFILSAKSIKKAPPSDFGWRDGDDEFVFHGGTSMATPLVAGCAALVREFLDKQRQMPNPSAALVKALLINGARPLNGDGAAPEIPNPHEGFGRINVPDTVGPFAEGTDFILRDERAGDEDTGLKLGESDEIDVTISPPPSRLKVTLVWTDPPGASLQNDLDLIVRAANGQERHGNVDPAETDPAKSFDRVNNVEQITWRDLPAGQAKIIVKCHRLTTASPSQKYALVIRTD